MTIPAALPPIPKPARSSVTPWDGPGMDTAVHLSTHVRDPVDQRSNRQGHRARPGWKYPSVLSSVAALSPTSSLVAANTINLGADLGAMAAALHLLVDGPTIVYVAGFAIVTYSPRFLEATLATPRCCDG